jgi:hypothetical protein
MPLIIKNERISKKEVAAVASDLESKLEAVAMIPRELQGEVEFEDDSNASAPQRQVIRTNRVSGVMEPTLMKSAVQKDNAVERLRKFIPSEVTVSWALVTAGFAASADIDKNTFTTVWVAFIGVVFIYVFESLRRERLIVHLENDLSIADMISHSFISSFAFVLYSMVLGPPFSLWGVPKWVPFVGIAVFTLLASAMGDPYVARPSKPEIAYKVA